MYVVTVNGKAQIYSDMTLANCSRNPTIFTSIEDADTAARSTVLWAKKQRLGWAIVEDGYEIREIVTQVVKMAGGI